MSSRSGRKWLLVTLSLAVVSAMSWAQGQDREFHWKGKLAPENVVEIKNVNGDIEADAATGDEVEVVADKNGPRADEVKIEVVQRGDGVMICAVFPGWFNNGCESSRSQSGNDKTRVHFTVKVPENIRLTAETVNGRVEAENMGRFVRASSVNGSVRVSTKAWVEMSSVNGSLDGRIGRSDWTGTLKAESVNGSITLELPSNTNADVSFKSVNGKLESDFPLTVQGSMGGGRMVRGKIGDGGRELKVETVNGSVHLRKASM